MSHMFHSVVKTPSCSRQVTMYSTEQGVVIFEHRYPATEAAHIFSITHY